jgi:hypothetical protein
MFLTGDKIIQAGTSGVFTLNYDQLVILAGSKDIYYSEKAVIKEVIISYKESSTVLTRPQIKTLAYKNDSTIAQINFSLKVNLGIWQLSDVLIKDFDGGELILGPRDILNHSEYEINIIEAI